MIIYFKGEIGIVTKKMPASFFDQPAHWEGIVNVPLIFTLFNISFGAMAFNGTIFSIT